MNAHFRKSVLPVILLALSGCARRRPSPSTSLCRPGRCRSRPRLWR